MATLADILVSLTLDTSKFKKQLDGVGQELNNFKNRVRQTTSDLNGEFTGNLSEMVTGLQNLSDSTERVSNNLKTSIDVINKPLNRVSTSTSAMSKNLGTGFQDMRKMLKGARTEFEGFGSTGTQVSQQVSEEFAYLPKHLQRYVERLQKAGQSTVAFSKLNEQYGKRNIETLRRTNDFLQNKTMQSTGIIKALKEQSLHPLSQQFLKLGERMENSARKGTALNLALTQLGENASPKALKDRMKLISTGVGRATAVMIGMGLVTGLSIWGLIKMSNVVDGRLVPAFETLKKTWLDALTPFVHVFTDFVLWIMNGATAVGELMKKFAETHPQLSSMFWGFILLTMALTTLLAPLAVGIGLAGGLSAGFALLWATIAPFVLGFLTVAGVAVLIAGAIVVLVAVIHNLWESSEAFRNAWIGIWEGVKTAFTESFVKPVQEAWGTLEEAFSGLIATFTGGEGTMSNLWTFLGDKIAIVVNAIAGVVLPILNSAFKLLGTVVVAVINGVVAVVTWLTEMWSKHGTEITAVLAVVWGVIQTVFGAITGFIMSKMPQIRAIISDTFDFIKAIIDFTMKYIAPIVVGAFTIIWNIIKFLMPTILMMIKGTWENITSIISSAINIVQNVIQLFSNILKGNWSGAWENVKNILKNAVILIWNLIQLYFLGRLLAPFKGFITAGKSLISNGFKAIVAVVRGSLSALKAFVVGVFSAMKTVLTTTVGQMRTTAVTKFNALKNGAITTFNALKSKVTTIFNAIKSAMTKPVETAKKTIMDLIAKIVSAFASMKISMPNIKMPKVGITEGKKTLFGKEFSYPKFDVQWNAKGGIFNGASILGGGQGVGEAGAEAVLPIQHKRYMRPFAHAVASHLGKGTNSQPQQQVSDKYEIIFNQPVIIRENADITRIVDELDKRKRIEQRSKGVFAFS